MDEKRQLWQTAAHCIFQACLLYHVHARTALYQKIWKPMTFDDYSKQPQNLVSLRWRRTRQSYPLDGHIWFSQHCPAKQGQASDWRSELLHIINPQFVPNSMEIYGPSMRQQTKRLKSFKFLNFAYRHPSETHKFPFLQAYRSFNSSFMNILYGVRKSFGAFLSP